MVFQSTRPIRGATSRKARSERSTAISIHAPHTGRDTAAACRAWSRRGFQSTRPIRGATRPALNENREKIIISIHAPHTGRDILETAQKTAKKTFQSTRPIRGATTPLKGGWSRDSGISIHAPHTGRDQLILIREPFLLDDISIHAPHTGRDQRAIDPCVFCMDFNPRAPYGARRWPPEYSGAAQTISIHAPHTGRDFVPLGTAASVGVFQSTRPIRGATKWKNGQLLTHTFQSTRPIRGATRKTVALDSPSQYFNPRAPYGARP